VRNHFRPEFLNRIDDVIVFDRLTRDDLRKIVDIQLSDLRRRLEARRVDLVVSDAALDMLADRGYDPVYGARPLKRLLQTGVADPLAKGLLEGTFSDGDTIKADVNDGELTFSN
jgi:ATP-dependent Clp protease ATP-binding subunit ClpB